MYTFDIEECRLTLPPQISEDFDQIMYEVPMSIVKAGTVERGSIPEFIRFYHVDVFDRLLKEVELTKETSEEDQKFAGVNFVITGSVEHFVNRAQVKEEIEKRGGKVTGSVTSKTNYLINNDTGSGTAKNKKARELGIPIISEEDFLQMMNE